ncbi:MAG: ABC transporter permease, partial [Planctomycetota bacterium]
MRSALRERTIVINSILLPIFLYPFLLWALFTALVYIQGQAKGLTSRVVITDLPEHHASFRESLLDGTSVELLGSSYLSPNPQQQIREGELDLLVELQAPSAMAAALAENFQVRLTYDQSKDRSRLAHRRIVEKLKQYRDQWLEEEGKRLGLAAAEWKEFQLQSRDVASGRERGAAILGDVLPLLLVIMVAFGCFYPAVDSTAGERERSTWETLMTVAASRISIVTSKYLYVATLGSVAALLNVTAMTVSMQAVFAPLLAGESSSIQFRIPLQAVPVMAIGAVLLALFVAAGMMILASFARTFKEGQSMVVPFYMLLTIPLLLMVGLPDQGLSATLALIPVVNVVLMLRDAIKG